MNIGAWAHTSMGGSGASGTSAVEPSTGGGFLSDWFTDAVGGLVASEEARQFAADHFDNSLSQAQKFQTDLEQYGNLAGLETVLFQNPEFAGKVVDEWKQETGAVDKIASHLNENPESVSDVMAAFKIEGGAEKLTASFDEYKNDPSRIDGLVQEIKDGAEPAHWAAAKKGAEAQIQAAQASDGFDMAKLHDIEFGGMNLGHIFEQLMGQFSQLFPGLQDLLGGIMGDGVRHTGNDPQQEQDVTQQMGRDKDAPQDDVDHESGDVTPRTAGEVAQDKGTDADGQKPGQDQEQEQKPGQQHPAAQHDSAMSGGMS